MKTITVKLDVSDKLSKFDIQELKRKCEMLADPNWVAVFWGVEDVEEVAPHLTEEQCREVLRTSARRHNAEVGINWITIETIANMLFDSPDEDEGEEELTESAF